MIKKGIILAGGAVSIAEDKKGTFNLIFFVNSKEISV